MPTTVRYDWENPRLAAERAARDAQERRQAQRHDWENPRLAAEREAQRRAAEEEARRAAAEAAALQRRQEIESWREGAQLAAPVVEGWRRTDREPVPVEQEIALMRNRPVARYPQPVVVVEEPEEPQAYDLVDFLQPVNPTPQQSYQRARQFEETTESRQDAGAFTPSVPKPEMGPRYLGWADNLPEVSLWRGTGTGKPEPVDPRDLPPNEDPMSMDFGLGMPASEEVFTGDDVAIAQTQDWRVARDRSRQSEATVLARQDEGDWAPAPPAEETPEYAPVPGAQYLADQYREDTAALPPNPAQESFDALPATQWTLQRIRDRMDRVDDPNYFVWAGDSETMRNAGARLSNFMDWTFSWSQKALSGIPAGQVDRDTGQITPQLRPNPAYPNLQPITLGQLLGVLGGAVNKSFNPFLTLMRRHPSALSISELADTLPGGENAPGSNGNTRQDAVVAEWATVGNWINKELARIGDVNATIAALPAEHTHAGNMALMQGTSGARAMERTLAEMVAKDNVKDLYMQADKALQAGNTRLASQLFLQAAALDNATYTEVWDKWSNPWAEMVEGVVLDPTSVVLDPLFDAIGAAFRGRQAVRLGAAGVDEVTYLAARREGEAIAGAVRSGQPVPNMGFTPWDNAWLIGKTEDAKAHVDADVVFGAMARLLTGVTSTQDAKQLLTTFTQRPQAFLAGVGRLAGDYFQRIADASGAVRFGAASFTNKETAERSWLISLVGDAVADMRSLKGEYLNPTELMAELDTIIYKAARQGHGLTALDELPAGAASYRTVTLPNGKTAVEYLDKAGKTVAHSLPMNQRQAVEYVKALDKALQGQAASPWMSALRSMDRVQRAIMSDMWLNLRPGHWMRNAMSATATLMTDDLYSLRPIGEVLDDLSSKVMGAPTPRVFEATSGVGRTLGAAAEAMGSEKHWSRIGPLDSPANLYAAANESANRIWTGMTQLLGAVPFGEQAFYVRAFDKGFNRTFRHVWEKMVQESLTPALVQAGMHPQAAENVAKAIVSAGVSGNKQTVAERATQMAQDLATTFDLSQLNIPQELFPLPVWRELNDALIGWQVNGSGASLGEMQQRVSAIIQRAKHHYAEILREYPQQPQTTFTLQTVGEDMAALVDDVIEDARAAGAPLDQNATMAVRESAAQIGQQQEANTAAVVNEIARNADVPEAARQAQMQVALDTWQGIQDVRDRARAAVDAASERALGQPSQWSAKWTETQRIYRESLQEEAAVVEQARRDLQTLIGGGEVQPRYDAWENINRYVEYDLDEIARARAFEPTNTAVQRERWQALIGAQRKYVDMSRAEMVRAFNVFPSADAFDLLIQADRRLNLRGASAAAYLTPLRNEALQAKNQHLWQSYFASRNHIWKDWADAAVTDYRNSGRMMLWMGIAERSKAEIRWVDPRTGGDFVLEWEEQAGKWTARDMRDGSIHTVGEGTGIPVPEEIQTSWRQLYRRATQNAEQRWQQIIEETLQRGRRGEPVVSGEAAAGEVVSGIGAEAGQAPVRELTPGVDFTAADRALPTPVTSTVQSLADEVDFYDVPIASRRDFQRRLQDAFGLSREEADSALALYDAHAEQWARYTRRTPDEWYAARIQRVTNDTPPGAAGAARGAVQFAEDGRAIIYAMRGGDISTVVHEGMHVWVRELQELALEHETAAADLSVLEVWAKVVDGKWTTEAHELVARAGERYLLEGRAPNERLATVFESFRQWLKSIYRKAKRTFKGDPKMTPEVRRVFDRLFAGGDEGSEAATDVVDDLPPSTTVDAPATTPAALEAIERRIEDIGEETAQDVAASTARDEDNMRFVEKVISDLADEIARTEQHFAEGQLSANALELVTGPRRKELAEMQDAYARLRLKAGMYTRRTIDWGNWQDVSWQTLRAKEAITLAPLPGQTHELQAVETVMRGIIDVEDQPLPKALRVSLVGERDDAITVRLIDHDFDAVVPRDEVTLVPITEDMRRRAAGDADLWGVQPDEPVAAAPTRTPEPTAAPVADDLAAQIEQEQARLQQLIRDAEVEVAAAKSKGEAGRIKTRWAEKQRDVVIRIEELQARAAGLDVHYYRLGDVVEVEGKTYDVTAVSRERARLEPQPGVEGVTLMRDMAELARDGARLVRSVDVSAPRPIRLGGDKLRAADVLEYRGSRYRVTLAQGDGVRMVPATNAASDETSGVIITSVNKLAAEGALYIPLTAADIGRAPTSQGGLRGLRVGDTLRYRSREWRIERVVPEEYAVKAYVRLVEANPATDLDALVNIKVPVDQFEERIGYKLAQEVFDAAHPERNANIAGIPDSELTPWDTRLDDAASTGDPTVDDLPVPDTRMADDIGGEVLARGDADGSGATGSGGGEADGLSDDGRTADAGDGAAPGGAGDSARSGMGTDVARERPISSGRSDGGAAGRGARIADDPGRNFGEQPGAAVDGLRAADSGEPATLRPDDRPDVETTSPAPPAPKHVSAPTAAGHDIVIDADIAHVIGNISGSKTRYRKNVDAIRLTKRLEAEGRRATPEEQAILIQFTGWGEVGLREGVFRDAGRIKPEWQTEYDALKLLLTEEEWQRAMLSSLNAHYTSPEVITQMWAAVRRMGGDRIPNIAVLEPAAGIGHFFGLMPADMAANARKYASELDPMSARIAKQLYQNAHVHAGGFETAPFADDFADLVITNVPFGEVGVVDPFFKKRPKHLTQTLHNYFFAKSLDKVRSGGVVAAITTHNTLDSVTAQVTREWLAERAELLGVIRLPRQAFAKNAGTEVVTDIIFLRKREMPVFFNDADEMPSWVFAEKTMVDEGAGWYNQPTINRWVQEHPEMVMGKHSLSGSMYRDKEYTVEALEGSNLAEQLAGAIARLPEDGFAEGSVAGKAITARVNGRNNAHSIVDGKVVQLVDGEQVVRKLTSDEADRITRMVSLSEETRELITLERSARASDEAIEAQRKVVSGLYDAFVKKYGNLNDSKNVKVFAGDPQSYLAQALEVGKSNPAATGRSKVSWTKADILSKRVLSPDPVASQADNASDALLITMRESNRVDMERMKELTGMSEEMLLNDLGERVYHNPYGDFEAADQYLSGDVKEKLALAEAAAMDDPRFERNVEALRKVQPEDIPISRIHIALGQNWIPPQTINDFSAHLFGGSSRQWSWTYAAPTNTWAMKDRVPWGVDSARFRSWSTDKVTADQVLRDTMMSKRITVNTKGPDGNSVFDPAATAHAQALQERMAKAFRDWIFNTPEQATDLHRLYNDKYNRYVKRVFDGSHLTFAGASSDVTLRTTQRAAVHRVLQQGNTLLAHEVGAGKTYTIVAASQEMKRLGMARKPVIVFPANQADAYPADFRKMYPFARILTPADIDTTAGGIERSLQRIATGDWDAILITQEKFAAIPVSEAMQRSYLNEQIAALKIALQETGVTLTGTGMGALERAAKTGDRSVRDMVKKIISLQERFEKTAGKVSRKDVLTWEQLGIDALFVDEADMYKNLAFVTVMNRVGGLNSNAATGRSLDMYMKVNELNKRLGNRNVVFATGTPIANSMTEAYTMMRYLQPEMLTAHNMEHFDAWARNFAIIERQSVMKPIGFVERERIKKYGNAQSLHDMLMQAWDVVRTSDIPGIVLPKAEQVPVVLAEDVDQRAVQRWLRARYNKIQEAIQNGEPGAVKGVDASGKTVYDIELNLYGDAELAAIDMRLIDPRLPDNPNSKLNTAVRKVIEIYHDAEVQARKGTQLIFLDKGVPGGAGFDLYNDIRNKLVAAGIPKEEIAFIQDVTDATKKRVLASKVNAGEIRVLIGGGGMETGLNVQTRLRAVHHVSFKWRPRDLEQRNGRIIRQGNTWENVQIYAYLQQPLDGILWDGLQRKQEGFVAFLKGAGGNMLEEQDAGSYEYALLAAMANGDEVGRRRAELSASIRRLTLEQDAYRTQIVNVTATIKNREKTLQSYQAWLPELIEDAALRDRAELALTIGDEVFTEGLENRSGEGWTAANQALTKRLNEIAKTVGIEPVRVGTFRGYDIIMTPNVKGWSLALVGKRKYGVNLTDTNRGMVAKFIDTLDSIDPEALRTQMGGVREEILASKKWLQENTFAQEDELARMYAEYERLEKQMRASAAENARNADQSGDAELSLSEIRESERTRRTMGETIAGSATTGDADDILYQGPVDGWQNRDWFGFMRTENPAQTLWEHSTRWLRKRPTPTISDVAAHQITTMEQAERAVLDALPGMRGQQRGGMSAPQQAALRAGIDRLMPRFDDAVYSASTMAQRASDFAMLNFKDRRHFDALLSIVFPFHFFWSRSAKNWAKRALRKPGVVNAYYETERAIAAENQQAGVPARMRGTIPLYTREDGTQIRIANPLHYALPFGMYFPGGFAMEDPQSQAEQWLQSVQQWTPGLMPLLQVAASAWFDRTNPLPNGEKRTDAYFAGGYVPQYGLVGMANAALGGRVLAGSADQWQTYRVTRAIPIIAQREGASAIVAGYAQQIAVNVRDNKGIYDKVPKQHQADAWALYVQGRTEAAQDRLASQAGGYFTGVNAYPWRPEEKLLTEASRQYGNAGYDPIINPAGSRAAQGDILKQYPMLSAWWNKSAGIPASDPTQPTPGDRAATSEWYDKRERIFERQANAVIHYFATTTAPTTAGLNEAKAPFRNELKLLGDNPGGGGPPSTRGMSPTERALYEIERLMRYGLDKAPKHPGDDATPEQLQAYYSQLATWETERLARVDASLRQLLEQEEHYMPWLGEARRLLEGQYTGNLLLEQEFKNMTAVERAWQEQRHFDQEVRDAAWQKKRGIVEKQLGSDGVAAFDQYMNTPAGDARKALKSTNPIFGAAVEAAYNPREYGEGVALFGADWYAVATGGPEHPGDNASEEQLQSYYDALDAYKAEHPEYDAVRLWWNGRPQPKPESQYRDYGRDYETAMQIFGADIFDQVLARQQAYAQSKAAGYAWQDANADAYKRVMGYNAWRIELADAAYSTSYDVPAAGEVDNRYKWMQPSTPAPTFETYTGPRPVGSNMPPLGSDPTYRYQPQGPAPATPPAPTIAGTAAPQTAPVPATAGQGGAQMPAPVPTTTQAPAAPSTGSGTGSPWGGWGVPSAGDAATIDRYAGQNETYTRNQAQAADWAQRKQGVYETFGADVGRLYETYLTLPKGEERTAFRSANPILRAVNLYTWQPDLYQQGVQQFGQDALVAWANAPVWNGTPEAEEARRTWWNDNPDAWLFNAWLNGRPQDYDEGDLGADNDGFAYNGGTDYAEAMRVFGDDIWSLAVQYRMSGTEDRRELRRQFEQLMPFFDWWYGNLPSQAPAVYRSADGLVTYNQWGQRLDSVGNVARGWYPSGGGGGGGGGNRQYRRNLRFPEVRAAYMNSALWNTHSERPWEPTGYGASWREAGKALRPAMPRAAELPKPSRPAQLPRVERR